MSSTPQKPASKMCKSPKSANFPTIIKSEKMGNEYDCTIIGSNNLHLVKKPQIVTSVSPAYSNPSPGYPQSPYSSPASLKSPSPQNFKPPTPQPAFPVMQIIQSNQQLIARPAQNVIKLKPHLNILPKPSASPQPAPKPSVSPHIVIPSQPTATIMPTAQPLLINQMPMLTPGVQLILRPQATKLPTHVQTATTQGLILQPSGQQLLQIQSPRTSQPMVRVLTNGMQLAPQTQVVSQVAASPVITHTTTQQAHIMQQNEHNVGVSFCNSNSPPKKKPKKKKQKLDLANIMKLSGIGDEDDIQFESDTSQSESEPTTAQIHADMQHHAQNSIIQEANVIRSQANVIQAADVSKRLGSIQFSAAPQPTATPTATPLVQLLNQGFPNGVNSASFQTSQAAPAGIPLNSFITPNITINNGLVVQRNGGFKLALGEDGRLVLQHDPTLNQDLQSQLLLQSIFGLNGLVLQPSIDQQIHSQTVQTIQQQSVQTIQQQTVQSQTIQTVQQQTVQPHHTLPTIQQAIQPVQAVQPQTVQQTVQQTIQHQTVQSQPLSTIHQHPHSQPMQIVQPQPIHTIQSQNIHHTIQSQPVVSLHSPAVQTIQSQVHQSIQSQIQGQIQSLLQQQQPLPTIQTQPVHTHNQTSQATSVIQPQHQTTQNQPILKVQPFHKTPPPVQTVHPQPIQAIQHQPAQSLNENTPNPSATSFVVNLTPEQLEQLKRNGQLTVNGQTLFMQRTNTQNKTPDSNHQVQNIEHKVKLSPKIKPVKKVNKVQNSTASPVKAQENTSVKTETSNEKVSNNAIKDTSKSSMIAALQAPPKITPVQNQAQIQPQHKAVVQPSLAVQPTIQSTASQTPLKLPVTQNKITTPTKIGNVQIQQQPHIIHAEINNSAPQDVENIFGQLLDDSPNATNATASNSVTGNQTPQTQPPQRIHTIQLTPQKQQHLKSIQLQIQTLSARLTPGDTEMQTALKLLFAEQGKILASGKLLPPDKVIYQNNQLTIINPSSLGIGTNASKTEVTQVLQAPVLPRALNEPCSSSSLSIVTTTTTTTVPKITVTVPPVSEQVTHISGSIVHSKPSPATPIVHSIKVPLSTSSIIQSAVPSQQIKQNKYMPSFTKAQLLEQQLNTDQNGAIKPDVHTQFRDKADACKRLIRYHCYNQPVLSQKDLNKADEIFELTARHFIDKFRRMVDKYRFLLNKESMRQVRTSELMMLDRMFLAEEQQSLIRLRQEMEEGIVQNFSLENNCQGVSPQQAHEDYDEWACIQREVGYLQSSSSEEKQTNSVVQQKGIVNCQQIMSGNMVQLNSSNVLQSSKRSASSDSRLETLKKFRVEKHSKKYGDSVQGNFVGVSNAQHLQVNSSGGIISASSGNVGSKMSAQQRNVQIQQVSYSAQSSQSQQSFLSTNVHNSVQNAKSNSHAGIQTQQYQQQMVHHQQTRTVHYATHPTGAAQNVFHSTNLNHQQHQQQYTQNIQFTQSHHDVSTNLHTLYGGQIIQPQHSSTQLLQQQTNSSSVVYSSANNANVNSKINIQTQGSQNSSESESGNNSIDEHVQSAIDSILNLQQNSNLDLDEAVSSILS